MKVTFLRSVISLSLLVNLGWASASFASANYLKLYSEQSSNKCSRILMGLHRLPEPVVVDLLKSPAKMESFYPAFGAITKLDNRSMIKASEVEDKNLVFVSGEIAVLKELNDNLFKDKDYVTKLVDLHKELFLEEMLDGDYPTIQREMVEAYTDFKSLRFAFRKNSTELKNELDQVLQSANASLADYLEKSGVAEEARHSRGLLRHPELWFLMGMGKTADQAGVAARASRKFRGIHELKVTQFNNIESDLDRVILQIEKDRENIERIFSRFPGILQDVPGAPGKKGLSRFALKVLIKTKPKKQSLVGLFSSEAVLARAQELQDYVDLVRERLGKAYGFDPKEISNQDALLLKRYVSELDKLMPGIFIEERVVIDLTRAKYSVVGMDFAGLNVWNFEQTQFALARDRSGRSAIVLKEIRKGEKIATRILKDKMKIVEGVFREVFGTPSFFTGDDGATFPELPATDHQKALTAQRLADSGEPDTFRLTFSDREIGNVEAELIEKDMRVLLEDYMPIEVQSKILLAVDTTRVERMGQVRLWIAGEFSEQDYAVLEKVFFKVLKQRKYNVYQIKAASVARADHALGRYQKELVDLLN